MKKKQHFYLGKIMSKTILTKTKKRIAYKLRVTYKNVDRIYAEIVLTCMMQTPFIPAIYLNNLTNKSTLKNHR